MTVDVNFFSAHELANRCAEEASKKEAKKRDDRFCYELVRRAFGLEDGEALDRVFNIYVKVWSQYWIWNPHQFDSHAYTAEDFLIIAFSKVYYEIKGSRFADFPLLNPFLSYLHITLVRVVAEYMRRQKGRDEIDSSNTEDDFSDLLERLWSSNNPGDEVEHELLLQEIRERIRFLIADEKDQLLLTCRAQGMKRAEIVASYSAWWPDDGAVRAAVQRIYRKLISDLRLYGLFEQLINKK